MRAGMLTWMRARSALGMRAAWARVHTLEVITHVHIIRVALFLMIYPAFVFVNPRAVAFLEPVCPVCISIDFQ